MDPANAKFVCGAECGIAVVGTASAGVEHWSSINGSPSVVTSGPATMRSTRAFRFNPSAAQSGLIHTFAVAISSPATVVGRFYVYFASFPTASRNIVVARNGAATATFGVFYNSSDNTLRGGRTTADMAASGAAVSTGQWYQVDFKCVFNTTTTVDIQVDSAPQTQYSFGTSADTCASILLGHNASYTADFYLDDVIISATSGDYPIGAGTVDGLYPNADGTHTYNAGGDFGDGAGGTTALATPSSAQTDTWTSLENPLNTTVDTNFVGAIGADTTLTGDRPAEFLRFGFEDLPADATAVNGVMLVATCHAASTTASNHRLHIDDGTNTPPAALINADLSETAITVPVAVATVAGDSAAWTVAKANATFVRFSSSDVNPDSFLDGLCLEVDYTAAPPEQVQRPYGTDPYRSLLAH